MGNPANRTESMGQLNAKKPEQRKKKTGQKKNLFERNPRKTLAFTAAFFILVLDALAGAIFNRTDDDSFRCSNPYYHHDFLPNRNAETVWGDQKYRVLTNSLGFRDGTVRDVPSSSKQKRILLMGDSFIEGMGVSYENSVAGILGESLRADGTEVLNAAALSYSPGCTSSRPGISSSSGISPSMRCTCSSTSPILTTKSSTSTGNLGAEAPSRPASAPCTNLPRDILFSIAIGRPDGA